MDADDNSPGTVYNAVSVTLLLAAVAARWSGGSRSIAVAGVMAMTWGDALAALIGRRMGRHRYQIWEVSVPGGLGGDVRGERGGNVSGTTPPGSAQSPLNAL